MHTEPLFRHVGIICKDTKALPNILKEVLHRCNTHGVEASIEKQALPFYKGSKKLQSFDIQKIENPNGIELIIVIGGDGTILRAAPWACELQIPMTGINLGTLGFLADIHPSHLENFTQILAGEYLKEQRIILQASCKDQNDNTAWSELALNEVALIRGHQLRMVNFGLWINNYFVIQQHADGMVVSTSTGSTAYALSAGGPIIHPSLDCLSIVPLCPHKLNSRPIIIPKHSKITIVPEQNKHFPFISCDSREQRRIGAKHRIQIETYSKNISLIHPKHYHFYYTLKEKLHWERKHYATPS